MIIMNVMYWISVNVFLKEYLPRDPGSPSENGNDMVMEPTVNTMRFVSVIGHPLLIS